MANEFIARNGIVSKSNLVVSGSLTALSTITAQTLVVQTITSSISSITGSTNFGSLSSNTHTFTGSMYVTGALYVPTGSVGIGTTSPSSKLTIESSTYDNFIKLTRTSIGSMGISATNPRGIQTTDGAGNFIGWHVNSSGSVGIGTSSPNAKLNVVNDDGVGSGLHVIADFNRNISSAELILGYYGDGTNVTTNAVYSANTLPLAFYTGAAERMRITSTGNVGIGTSSPTRLLNLYATIPILQFTNPTTGVTQDDGLLIYQNGLNSVIENQEAGYLSFLTTAAERMRINNSGQITTPSQPAFYAYGVGGGTYASGNYWIFPSTQINRGSHYNTANGVFTVPVAGTYLFAFGHIMGTSATVYRWFLRINNSDTGAGPIIQLRMDRQGYSTSSYGWNVSKTAILNLAAGDTVRIYSAADDGGAFHPGTNAATEEYPYFSGYLLG
jgi:hypothetical protein